MSIRTWNMGLWKAILRHDLLGLFSFMGLRGIIKSFMEESLVIKTGRYLYHSSDPTDRIAIDKNGLQLMHGDKWMKTSIEGPAIFATDAGEDHGGLARDNDLWRIDTYECPEVKWKMDTNFERDNPVRHVYTRQSIPRKGLELVHKGIGEVI